MSGADGNHDGLSRLAARPSRRQPRRIGDLDIRAGLRHHARGRRLGQVLLQLPAVRPAPVRDRLEPGRGPEAGLPIQRDVFWAFVLCGAMAGLAGFLFLARFGNITVVAGQGLELAVVAAVVVGGVNIFGGSGSMIGALLGAMLIEVLQQSLMRWIGISEFVRDILLGLLILLAVAGDKIILGRLQDAWVRVRRRDDAAAATPRGRSEATVARRACGALPQLGRAPARSARRGRRLQRARGRPATCGIQNQVNLSQLGIEKAIVVLAMTFVIISGEIDLSVASVMGLRGGRRARLLGAGRPDRARDPRLRSLAGLRAGSSTASGSPSSACRRWSSRSRGSSAIRGLAYILIEDRSIGGVPGLVRAPGPAAGPRAASRFDPAIFGPARRRGRRAALGPASVAHVCHRQQPRRRPVLGRACRAAQARRSSSISGLVAALAACSTRRISVRSAAAPPIGFELDIITIVLLGGVSIFGGSGTMVGVVLSTFLVLNLRNGLRLATCRATPRPASSACC